MGILLGLGQTQLAQTVCGNIITEYVFQALCRVGNRHIKIRLVLGQAYKGAQFRL